MYQLLFTRGVLICVSVNSPLKAGCLASISATKHEGIHYQYSCLLRVRVAWPQLHPAKEVSLERVELLLLRVYVL